MNLPLSIKAKGFRRIFSSLTMGITFAMIVLCATPIVMASETDTRQAIFHPGFHTLTVRADGELMSVPVLRLGTEDRLEISFDEIGDDYRYLQYRLIHCNADWQPSRLLESEYLEGFNIGEISDYAFSSNTFVHFVNYHLTFPQEGMTPLVSGNYLLQVFDQDDPDEVLLQLRFAVSENSVGVDGIASGRTDKGFNTTWQQVDFSLMPHGIRIGNPYQDLTVTVTQNGRDVSRRSVSHPLRVEGERITFGHAPELVFPASNEYRRFETVRISDPGMHVDSIRYGGSNYHVWLTPDEWRAEGHYRYDSTQRGRFLVRESNSTDSDLGADYVTVHFTLDCPEIADADIYLDGELTGHEMSDRWKMSYDYNTHLYTLQAPLKQGSYNYQYVAVPRKGGIPTPAPIEGDFHETINEYLVEVFYHPPGARADRLLGHAVIVARP